MGQLVEKTYSLKNVRVTLQNGIIADLTEIQIKRKLEKADRTAGMSGTEQTVIVKELMPEIKIKGWNSDNLSHADLVPQTAITAFTILSTSTVPQSLMQSDFFTKWPITGMCIGDTDTTLGEKPSEWNTEVLAGVLNPVPVVVAP